MPIEPPRIDARTFAQLRDEALSQVAAHVPEWTHIRPGDPGYTLAELFAHIMSSALEVAQEIPELERVTLLRLVGERLRPASPARGVVFLEARSEASLVEARTRLAADGLRFETLDEVEPLPFRTCPVFKRKLCPVEEQKLLGEIVALATMTGVQRATPFRVGKLPETECVDLADPVAGALDRSLWLPIIDMEKALRSAEERKAAAAKLGRKVLSVGLCHDWDDVEVTGHLDGARARWEVSTGALAPDGSPRFVDLDVVSDTTAGGTRSGVVRLRLPDATLIGLPAVDAVLDGSGRRPPRLESAEDETRLVAWLRLRLLPGTSHFRLRGAGLNGVEVEQMVTARNVNLGVGSGEPDQVVSLRHRSVDPETLEIDVAAGGGLAGEPPFEPWAQVHDLAAAGRFDRVYVLDPEAGTIRFGDGLRGRRPPRGAAIRARSLRAGGGAAGNLTKGCIKSVEGHPGLTVQQRFPLRGGADAETMDQARERVPRALRHNYRAVTAEDFCDLARETPGETLGRVEVLPFFKPHQRVEGVPGVVSVMVWPERSTLAGPAPRPDARMLRAVDAQLQPRRLLTTELYVIAPEYVAIAVSTSVRIRDGFGVETALRDVERGLRATLFALPSGALDGRPWPLGRAVRGRDLEAAVARVDGVRSVEALLLYARDGAGLWQPVPEVGSGGARVELRSWQLPELLTVAVTSQGPAGSLTGLAPDEPLGVPSDEDRLLQIPATLERCT